MSKHSGQKPSRFGEYAYFFLLFLAFFDLLILKIFLLHFSSVFSCLRREGLRLLRGRTITDLRVVCESLSDTWRQKGHNNNECF